MTVLALAGPVAAEDVVRHPACPGPVTVAPGGEDVAGFVVAGFGDQERAVRAFRDGFPASVALGAPPACVAFYAECIAAMPDDPTTAVAQGYLTGRDAMGNVDAAQGIFEALGSYCLGTWTPGTP
jgi:hypothetical protein